VLRRAVQALLLASTLPVVAACAGSPATPPATDIVASVIVKPRTPATAESVLKAARDTLGADAGVRYARPMAGDAHILYLTAPATRAQVPALVDRLQASGTFQYVELDSMMKKQQ
jgi:hypothetical protein